MERKREREDKRPRSETSNLPSVLVVRVPVTRMIYTPVEYRERVHERIPRHRISHAVYVNVRRIVRRTMPDLFPNEHPVNFIGHRAR